MTRFRRSRNPLALVVCALACLVLVPVSSASAAKGKSEDSKQKKSKQQAQSSRDTPGFYSTTVGRSANDMVVVQYWSKAALFRSETIVAGHPIITLVNGDRYYTWDGLTKSGYVVKRSAPAVELDASRTRPFGMEFEDVLADGGEKIRSETLNGIATDVYRVTDESGRRTLWVTTDSLRLPLRLETFERKSGRSGLIDWVSWIPGLVIPDRYFDPPPDVDLRRFDSYQDYLAELQEGPVLPVPPLFHYLLHQRGGE
jgi:outer membrane lipoprotein-sorting protein